MQPHVIKQNITETLESNYMPYAMSVIVSRALPEIDGFKPAHRKLLYTMYKMGLLKQGRTKSANIVGQTMRLNPHGDSAIYETMVRLTKGYAALNMPFVDSKGNFGKIYSRDMAYAASRYTEAKLSEICNEVFRDIEEDAVDFIDNYDGTMKEPTLLPTLFPSILVNPNQGIAVGMASNICSFNLKEVCDTTIAYLKNEKNDILNHIIAPDFPTGGVLLYNKNDMYNILSTGRGSFKLRAKYSYIKKENCIEITEIPYTTTVEVIIDKIEELVKSGKIKEIVDVRDEIDLSGLKLTIDLKRGVNADLLMQKLFKLTTLEDSFSCNFNILINGKPKVMGVPEVISEWCTFRKKCIIRKYQFAINKMEKRLHLLFGLKQILLDIDKAIDIVRNTDKDNQVIPNLMLEFDISQLQAEFVADIKLRHLNKQYIIETLKELDKLEKEIDKYKYTITHDEEIRKVIITELKQVIKKYAMPRHTEIIEEKSIPNMPMEVMVEDYNLKLFFTSHQYLKKITLASLRNSGDHKLKDEDTIVQEIDTTNKSELLLFSDKCNVYKLKLHEIEDSKVSQLGIYIPNLLELEEDEKIIFVHATTDYLGYLLFGFTTGKVTKVQLSAYQTKTNRKKLIKAYYGGATCVGIVFALSEGYVELEREDGKSAIVSTEIIPEKQKRDAIGVQVLSITKKANMKNIKMLADDSQITNKSIATSIPTAPKVIRNI